MKKCNKNFKSHKKKKNCFSGGIHESLGKKEITKASGYFQELGIAVQQIISKIRRKNEMPILEFRKQTAIQN